MENSSRRTAVFRLIVGSSFAVLLLAIAFLVVELFERYRFYRIHTGNPYVLERRENTLRDAIQMGLVEALWEKGANTYRPDALVSENEDLATTIFSTTPRGFRRPDHPVPKPPGKFRIVCIGASTTVEGSRNEKTYPALLEKELNARFQTDRIEVVNCGVTGLTSELQRANLPAYLREEPDLVIEYFGINDICWLLGPLWERFRNPLQSLASKSKAVVTHLDHWLTPSAKEIERDQWRSSMINLDYLYQAFKQQGVDFMLCTFARPDLESCSPDERDYLEYNMRGSWNTVEHPYATYGRILDSHNRNLHKFAEARGIPLIRVAEELRGTLDIFTDACHLLDNGIALKATIIANHVERHLRAKWSLDTGRPLPPDLDLDSPGR